ncbi:hypothetical protein D3C87_1509160 [compost metagenome]
MANGKKKAAVWYSKGDVNGNRVAKGQTYRETSVGLPAANKRAKGHVTLQK